MNRVLIKITGRNPEYFLRKLIKLNINLLDIKIERNCLFVLINYNDLESITNIKTSYNISIYKRIGLCKYVYFIKKHKIFDISLVFIIIVLFVLSRMIFYIDIKSNNKSIRDNIRNELRKYGIYKYSFKKNFKEIQSIKEKIIKNTNNNIEWMEIEEKIYKYEVKIVNRKINKENDECYPRNIVSSKACLITSIKAESGEVVKNINDYVNKGDTIISGLIHNNDKVVSKRCSVGKVFGEVWYIVNISMPREEYITKILGKNRGISINIFNNKYLLFHKGLYKNKNVITTPNIIPISVSIGSFNKYKIIRKVYNYENVDNEAISIGIKKLKPNGRVLSKKVLKKVLNNSRIDIEVFYKIEEDVTDYLDISNVNIDSINNSKE